MLTFMEKKFYLVGITDFFICVINKELVFSCKQKGKIFYAKIDSTISISKENNFLIIKEKEKESLNFPILLARLDTLICAPVLHKKKLILRGIGYRMNLMPDLKAISFKLGYSHLLSLNIPKEILNVRVQKNFISFQSYDISFLGDFSFKIKLLRKPDSYKGKGFLKKNEIIKLKLLKKK